LVLPHINLSNFESVLNWRNWNKFWRVCVGCYQSLIPYISIGNCNSELMFGMRASFSIHYKNMTSYPIISKILFLWHHHFRTLLGRVSGQIHDQVVITLNCGLSFLFVFHFCCWFQWCSPSDNFVILCLATFIRTYCLIWHERVQMLHWY